MTIGGKHIRNVLHLSFMIIRVFKKLEKGTDRSIIKKWYVFVERRWKRE